MNKYNSILIAFFLLLSLTVKSQIADNGDGTFSNPVIFADVPDPSVVRVGDSFYMVSTTMHMSPGCTIMKSYDLVNWEVVNYAYDQLEETDSYALKNGLNDYANGSWAANIRYDKYEKRYYVIVTCNTSAKSYIFSTDDVENGAWHRSEVEKCYDPGFLFEDTGMECIKYIVYPYDELTRHEGFLRKFIVDKDHNVTLGDKIQIIDYANLENPAEGLRAEGYHGYKIGEYYYIFMIQGRGWQRQQIVWRSKTLEPGSFEPRLIFAGDIEDKAGNKPYEFTGIAQGGIVDTADGDWYAFLFQDYGAVARMPVLIPMVWEDGWPVLGNNGKSVDLVMKKPVQGYEKKAIVVSDEFNNGSVRKRYSEKESANDEYKYYGSNLHVAWQWNHNPDNRFWSLIERPGYLRLKSGTLANNIQVARNTLTQRTFGPTCSGSIALEVQHMKNGDVAGLSAFQNQYGFVGVRMENGQKQLIMQRAQQKDDAQGIVIESIPLHQERIYLRVDCDFKERPNTAYFFYSLDGENWTRIGDVLQMVFDWPHFVGYRFGLFYYATEETGGYVDFDYFKINNI